MMLTLEDGISLDDHYTFKSSPESCGDNFTDYMEVSSDDFIQQLSSDLDIPLLLNPGDDEFNVLSSYFDKSPDEILSNVSSPLSTAKLEDISKELKELQQLDFSQWGPEAFPNLTEVKTEDSGIKKESSDGYSSSDSSKSSSSDSKHSYQTHQSARNTCNETIEMILQEPQNNHEVPSPERKQYYFNYEPIFSNTGEQVVEKQLLHNHVTNAAKLTERQVPIRPRAPIAPAPESPQSQVVFIKNEPPSPKQNALQQPKVVFLENSRRMPMTTIPQIPQSKTIITAAGLSNISSSVTSVSLSPVIINTSKVSASVRSTLDPKAFKRQQRKIRNRESACLSRKKKKEYLTALEEQVRDLTLENQRLKNENSQLKERLAQYENRPASPSGKTVKSSVVLCVFLFVLGINLDFINNTFNPKIQMSEQMSDFSKISDHHGRSLLWAPKTDSMEAVSDNTTSANLLSLSMCPADINQTESARLVLELERWIGKPDSVKANNISINNQKTKPKLKRRKFRIDTSVAPSSLGKRIDNYSGEPLQDGLKNELQIFSPPLEQMYSEFFEAINRQNDTFYVVSFSQHHMLLPALNHNNTRRPKMSLIMPSVIPDDFSGHPASMPLMQIDCEVLDTRLIHVKYGTIPEHLRNSTFHRDQNTMDPGSSSPTSSTHKRSYKPYFMKRSGIKYKPFSNYYDLN